MAKRTYTDEEKAAKRAEQVERVKAAVEAISTEDGFRRWLTVSTRGNIARFSFRNQMLVAYQNPKATYVLTYNAWANLGRQVQKGQHAMYVLKPIIAKVPVKDADGNPVMGENGKPLTRDQLVGWSDLAEFDITQTDGEPVHTPDRELHGDDALVYQDGLVTYAEQLGYTVEFKDLEKPGLGGYCNTLTKAIVVNTHNGTAEEKRARSGNERMSTLIHEIAHAHDIDYEHFTREDAEVIVEMTAALVLMTAGLSDIDACAEYIACWCRGDAKVVEARCALASKLASTIEKAAGIETAVTGEVAIAA